MILNVHKNSLTNGFSSHILGKTGSTNLLSYLHWYLFSCQYNYLCRRVWKDYLPKAGLEPVTFCLEVRCSTNWPIQAIDREHCKLVLWHLNIQKSGISPLVLLDSICGTPLKGCYNQRVFFFGNYIKGFIGNWFFPEELQLSLVD